MSSGPRGGGSGVVSVALTEGSVSFASCFFEQPPSSTAPTAMNASHRHVTSSPPCRSPDPGDYAGQELVVTSTCGQPPDRIAGVVVPLRVVQDPQWDRKTRNPVRGRQVRGR